MQFQIASFCCLLTFLFSDRLTPDEHCSIFCQFRYVCMFIHDGPRGSNDTTEINKHYQTTRCTCRPMHVTQHRQSLLDNSQHSQHSRAWRIVDQCLPASQITCRLGVPSRSAPVSGHSTLHAARTSILPAPAYAERTTFSSQCADKNSLARSPSHYQKATILPRLGQDVSPRISHITVRRVALRNTAATVPSRSWRRAYGVGPTCRSSRAAQANICTARLSLQRVLGIPHCRPSPPNFFQLTVFHVSKTVDDLSAASTSTLLAFPSSTQPV